RRRRVLAARLCAAGGFLAGEAGNAGGIAAYLLFPSAALGTASRFPRYAAPRRQDQQLTSGQAGVAIRALAQESHGGRSRRGPAESHGRVPLCPRSAP